MFTCDEVSLSTTTSQVHILYHVQYYNFKHYNDNHICIVCLLIYTIKTRRVNKDMYNKISSIWENWTSGIPVGLWEHNCLMCSCLFHLFLYSSANYKLSHYHNIKYYFPIRRHILIQASHGALIIRSRYMCSCLSPLNYIVTA